MLRLFLVTILYLFLSVVSAFSQVDYTIETYSRSVPHFFNWIAIEGGELGDGKGRSKDHTSAPPYSLGLDQTYGIRTNSLVYNQLFFIVVKFDEDVDLVSDNPFPDDILEIVTEGTGLKTPFPDPNSNRGNHNSSWAGRFISGTTDALETTKRQYVCSFGSPSVPEPWNGRRGTPKGTITVTVKANIAKPAGDAGAFNNVSKSVSLVYGEKKLGKIVGYGTHGFHPERRAANGSRLGICASWAYTDPPPVGFSIGDIEARVFDADVDGNPIGTANIRLIFDFFWDYDLEVDIPPDGSGRIELELRQDSVSGGNYAYKRSIYFGN